MSTQIVVSENPGRFRAALFAIRNWIARRRYAASPNRLRKVPAETVVRIAHDLEVSADDLYALDEAGPDASRNLHQLLDRVGVDPAVLGRDPMRLQTMETVCSTCGHKLKCDFSLARGSVVDGYLKFCPNSQDIKSLLRREKLSAQA